MTNLRVFRFQGREVRTENRKTEVWFCLKDICDILGLINSRQVTEKLNRAGVSSVYVSFPSGSKRMTFINEPNLYRVIFQSRKPEAEKFVEWVTSEVLPSIRKHGAYVEPGKLEELLRTPDGVMKLLTELQTEQARRRELSRTNARLMHTGKTYTATTIAKELGFRDVRDFNRMLHRDGIQYKHNGVWIPYARYTEAGLLVNKQDRNGYYSTKWTQKGRAYLLNKYEGVRQ